MSSMVSQSEKIVWLSDSLSDRTIKLLEMHSHLITEESIAYLVVIFTPVYIGCSWSPETISVQWRSHFSVFLKSDLGSPTRLTLSYVLMKIFQDDIGSFSSIFNIQNSKEQRFVFSQYYIYYMMSRFSILIIILQRKITF